MSDETRGCVAVVVVAVLLLAGAAWYCLSHGCYVGGWGLGPKPVSLVSPVVDSSPTPSPASFKVAVLDEPTAPDYLDGTVENSSDSALDAVRASGLDAETISSEEIEAGVLDDYDVLILPDNAPPASAVDAVLDWWSRGHYVVATDSANGFLLYSGILFPELKGAGASASRGEYWDDTSTGSVVVKAESCPTSGLRVNEELEAEESSALIYANELPPEAQVLAVDGGQPNKAAVVVYRGEGTVTFIGPDPSMEYLEEVLTNVLFCVLEEQEVAEEIDRAIDDQGLAWEAGTTSVSGLSEEEERTVCGDTSDYPTFSSSDHDDDDELPSNIDWRDVQGENWLTPIRNQGHCGSCVAHAALGAFESVLKIASDDPYMQPDLSEEYLFGRGCGKCCKVGWRLKPAASFLFNEGVPDESCSRYTAQDTGCDDCCEDVEDRLEWAIDIRELTSAKEMKRSLVENGPILAGMKVYQDFLRYKGGVYEHAWGEYRGGHAITIVGYDDEEGYWIAKNSWGTGWGERGYFRIAYGAGIYNQAYELQAAPGAMEEPLVIGTTGSLDTLDPAEAWSFSEWEILLNVMDTLVVYAPGTTDIEPGLAESWEVSEDGFDYTFHLREGLVFPDGTPFTSGAVVWSIERVVNLGEGPAYLVTDLVDYVEAVDDYTVRFVLHEPNARFLSALTTAPYAPVSPDCFPEDEFDAKSTCGGIGHYSIGGWVFSSHVELVANPDYYGDPAESPSVIVRYFADPDGLRQALEDGEVDVAWDWGNPSAYIDLVNDPGFNVYYGPSSVIRILCFNTTEPPFDDPLVRQAIEFAVDRQMIADMVFEGLHWPLFSLVPEGVRFHSEDTKPYDAEQSVMLLEEAGFGATYPLEIELWWAADHYGETEADLAESLERSLETTGAIDVSLRSATWAEYVDYFVSGELPVFLLRWIPDWPDPENYVGPLVSCDGSTGIGVSYCSGELEDLLWEARQTVDPEEREELYYEIQDLLAGEVPVIPLTQSSLLVVTQPNVEGVVLDASNLLRYWNMAKEWFGGAPAPAAAPAAPKVTLELVEGEVAVVVDGRVSEISFDGLQKLAPQPGADGKTRIDIPDILPDETGQIVFNFTYGGKRYQARIKVTYNDDGTRTLQLLGVSEVAEPAAEPTAEAPATMTPTPVPPTPTPTSAPSTSTPTRVPATPTSTRAAPTSTPSSVAPTIVSVDFPSSIRADGTDASGTVRFRDSDGDLNYATFDVVSAVDFSGFGFDPTSFLVSGTARDGTFQFHVWSETVQQVTLRVTLWDAAGNKSAPVEFTFDCR